MRLLGIVLVLLVLSGLAVVMIEQNRVGSITIKARMANLDLIREASRAFQPLPAQRPIVFPADLGSHPEQQTDGWFYSGYLTDENGRQYGLQFALLRFGLSRGLRQGDSEWTTNQIYLANFGLTDVSGGVFMADERFARGNNRLAGAENAPYRVWVENWSAAETAPGQTRLKTANVDVTLIQSRAAVWPANAQNLTYYLIPAGQAQGVITTTQGAVAVSGYMGQYHVWGNLDLGAMVGWYLVWLRLDDGRELVYFKAQTDEQAAAGDEILLSDMALLTDEYGQMQFLSPDTMQLTPTAFWQSQVSQINYPSTWNLTIPDQDIDLEITPLLDDQEHRHYLTYWKGLVSARGSQSGYGYVEMTGQKIR